MDGCTTILARLGDSHRMASRSVSKARQFLWLSLAALGQSAFAAEPPDFERDVAPLLVNHCLDCHQPKKRSGKLDLSTWTSLLVGGEQGPTLTPGKPTESLLVQRITAGEMPPPDAKDVKLLSEA